MNPKEIINQIKTQPANIRRLEYTPYRMEVAEKVFLQILKGMEKNYDHNNRNLIIDLIKYAHGEEGNWDLSRGLGFIGNAGTGKTLTLTALSQYLKIDDVKFIKHGKVCKFGYEVISARQLASQFSLSGYDAIQPSVLKPVLCIDDLGSEPENINHYGNKINLIEHIIEERYMNERFTHFSSNLSMGIIHEKYGDRVYSRIKGSTNIIKLTGKDWRL